MKAALKVAEVVEKIYEGPIKGQVQITNASDAYINNLKLIIAAKNIQLTEECVVRQRGSLCFDPGTDELMVGNLAPNETACFEYSFTPLENNISLSSQMTVSYTPEYSDKEVFLKIAELIDPLQN